MNNKTEKKNFYEIPHIEVIAFDCKDVIVTSGNPINFQENNDKWSTPKIDGGN